MFFEFSQDLYNKNGIMRFIRQVSNTTLLTAFMNSQAKLKIRFPKLLLVFASYQHVVQISLFCLI